MAGGTRPEQVGSLRRHPNPGVLEMVGLNWSKGTEMKRGSEELFRKSNEENIVL